MTCCEECAYPGNPGVCVKAGTCPCHDVEEDPVSRISRVAASYDSGNGEAQALTAQALARLAYRRRHSGKTCSHCQETKPLSAFGPDTRKPDGLDPRCRECEGVRKREARRRV
ncbi:HNH endonuclease [Arthrobacter phage Janeemi]|uniref:HNH endonuclease n=1 Tax=Arthrobacter phage Janeemi TaxID=2927240 RepID=A0A9E7QM58_9CAUD|nr:HNH endonuclease [Arthrobacter phage Janeemi]